MTSYQQTRNKRIGLDERISNFVAASVECGFAGRDSLSRKELYTICDKTGIVYPRWLAKEPSRRLTRGMYSFPELANAGVTDLNDSVDSLSTEVPAIEEESSVTIELTDEMIDHTVYCTPNGDGTYTYDHNSNEETAQC